MNKEIIFGIVSLLIIISFIGLIVSLIKNDNAKLLLKEIELDVERENLKRLEEKYNDLREEYANYRKNNVIHEANDEYKAKYISANANLAQMMKRYNNMKALCEKYEKIIVKKLQ